MGADLSEGCGLIVIVAGDNEVDDGVEQKLVRGVVSFSRAGEHGEYNLQCGEGVSGDFEVVKVVQGSECNMYGGEFGSEDDVVFVEARGID